MKNIKVFISYHKPFFLLKTNIFSPIHSGRDVFKEISKDGILDKKSSEWLLNNLIGDNTGDNISHLNRQYSELTSLYWIWKHYEEIGNPDYIGLMSYRRFFLFNEFEYDVYNQNNIEKAYREISLKHSRLSKEQLEKYWITDTKIDEYLDKYDLILPLKSELKLVNTNSVREDYKKNIPGVNIKDYDLMVETVSKQYPEFRKYILEQQSTSRRYFYQMFIMRKDMFFDYCTFLFSVLFKIEKLIDTSNYSVNGKRTLGYLGEALYDCYMRRVISENNVRYKELGVVKIIEDKEYQKEEIMNNEKEFILLGFRKNNNYVSIYILGLKVTIKL